MNERKEICDVLEEFDKRISNIYSDSYIKGDYVTKELKKFKQDFGNFVETYKKIEAPCVQDNASN